MFKERIQEILDFTKSESPYRKANKGWINKDIFLDLSSSSTSLSQYNEAAKITLLWSPINKLISNLFLILIISSLIVFSSIAFVKGQFNFDLFKTYSTEVLVEVQENVANENMKASDNDISYKEKELSMDEIIDSKNLDLSDNLEFNLNQELLDNETYKPNTKKEKIKSNKDLKILENKKPKSNFI